MGICNPAAGVLALVGVVGGVDLALSSLIVGVEEVRLLGDFDLLGVGVAVGVCDPFFDRIATGVGCEMGNSAMTDLIRRLGVCVVLVFNRLFCANAIGFLVSKYQAKGSKCNLK